MMVRVLGNPFGHPVESLRLSATGKGMGVTPVTNWSFANVPVEDDASYPLVELSY